MTRVGLWSQYFLIEVKYILITCITASHLFTFYVSIIGGPDTCQEIKTIYHIEKIKASTAPKKTSFELSYFKKRGNNEVPQHSKLFKLHPAESCELQMFCGGREVKNTPVCVDYMVYCTFNVKLSSQNPPTWFWLWGQTSVRAGALEETTQEETWVASQHLTQKYFKFVLLS